MIPAPISFLPRRVCEKKPVNSCLLNKPGGVENKGVEDDFGGSMNIPFRGYRESGSMETVNPVLWKPSVRD